MLQREIECERPSSRKAKQVGLLDLKVVQQAQEILARREWRFGLFLRRVSPATQVIAQHLILLCKHLELVVPGSAIQQQAMNQGKGMSCTSNFVIQLCVVHMSNAVSRRLWCHAISSFFVTARCQSHCQRKGPWGLLFSEELQVSEERRHEGSPTLVSHVSVCLTRCCQPRRKANACANEDRC